MSLRQLPIELLDAICQQALPADLVSLSSTASSILPVAQRLLYRHISVSQHLGVVATLAKKPELAHHVRTFALTLLDCSTVFDAFYRLLAVALFSMTELTSLDLFVDSGASWILTATPHLTFPRLVHFSCSFPLDSHLASFLSTTEALLELEISGSEILPIPVLPDASIPRLSHFIGSSHAANAVVPGRPVESIHLQSGDLTESDAVTLAKSSAQIIILSATTSSLPVSLLETLTQCMPRLAYLRMMTTYNFPQAPDVAFYEQTAKALGTLSDLKGFELSGMHWGSSQKADDDVGRVWQSQPLLNHIATVEDVRLDEDLYSDLFFAY